MPTFTQDTTLLFCFGSCETDGTCTSTGPAPVAGDITFSVDMSNYTGSFTNVYVSGTMNGWSGNSNQLTDMGNGIYSGTLSAIGPGNIEYKFTVDNWADDESLIAGSSCTVTNWLDLPTEPSALMATALWPQFVGSLVRVALPQHLVVMSLSVWT